MFVNTDSILQNAIYPKADADGLCVSFVPEI